MTTSGFVLYALSVLKTYCFTRQHRKTITNDNFVVLPYLLFDPSLQKEKNSDNGITKFYNQDKRLNY